ncbi:hypothetical protein KAR34_04765 [bacterium]|nr:hypothetical protein [bacterium]
MNELRTKILKIIDKYKLKDGIVRVRAKVLSPEEAIGNPEHNDYPIQKGRERLMQAEYEGAFGVAFTDMFGNYEGSLYEIINMELNSNFRRAIFVATINAVLCRLGLIDKTGHCKDAGPVNCQKQVVGFIKERFENPKIFMIGLQPRLLEALSSEFELRATDLDENNIGKEINQVKVESVEAAEKNIKWCSLIFATGSTFVNETYQPLMAAGKPAIFFGVTGAGPVYLLNQKRYCPDGLSAKRGE